MSHRYPHTNWSDRNIEPPIGGETPKPRYRLTPAAIRLLDAVKMARTYVADVDSMRTQAALEAVCNAIQAVVLNSEPLHELVREQDSKQETRRETT